MQQMINIFWQMMFGSKPVKFNFFKNNQPKPKKEKTYTKSDLNFLKTLSAPVINIKAKPRVITERELIQKESLIGAKIFGENPYGLRREFFNLDQSTWIFYDEKYIPGTKKVTGTTIRYEIHKNGVLKVQEGPRYDFIEGQELDNFIKAVDVYYKNINEHIYNNPTFALST